MKPAEQNQTQTRGCVGVIVERIVIPSLLKIFDDKLRECGDPLKAFIAVQVEFTLISNPGRDRSKTEEEIAKILSPLRSFQGDLATYCRGILAGIIQGFGCAMAMMQDRPFSKIADVQMVPPNG